MSELIINLKAIKQNYEQIRMKVGEACEVAGVVKANAYGCGVVASSQTLFEAGCRTFFVATLPEALELRTIIGHEPKILMLGGFDREGADLYTESAITPVLNQESELSAYRELAKKVNRCLPAVVHIDTGMNRLGFEAKTIQSIADDSTAFDGIDLQYVMTHFASADEKDNPKSKTQAESFMSLAPKLPCNRYSLCNSFGVFRDSSWHKDLVRPGMALYGLNPTPETSNPMQSVVSLSLKILQIKDVEAGDTCGYNETYRFDKKSKVAIVSAGYADGIFVALSNKAKMYWQGIECPVRGRVSMDLAIVDLSDVEEAKLPSLGDELELLGPHQSADDLAACAGTVGYEIITSLSRRYKRTYTN